MRRSGDRAHSPAGAGVGSPHRLEARCRKTFWSCNSSSSPHWWPASDVGSSSPEASPPCADSAASGVCRLTGGGTSSMAWRDASSAPPLGEAGSSKDPVPAVSSARGIDGGAADSASSRLEVSPRSRPASWAAALSCDPPFALDPRSILCFSGTSTAWSLSSRPRRDLKLDLLGLPGGSGECKLAEPPAWPADGTSTGSVPRRCSASSAKFSRCAWGTCLEGGSKAGWCDCSCCGCGYCGCGCGCLGALPNETGRCLTAISGGLLARVDGCSSYGMPLAGDVSETW